MTPTRHERLQTELKTAQTELVAAEAEVTKTREAWAIAREKRDQVEREVGDLRNGLGMKRDGTEKQPRARRGAGGATEAPDAAEPIATLPLGTQ